MLNFFDGVRRVLAPMRVIAFCLIAAACTPSPERLAAGVTAADPAAPVPASAYRSVLSGYVSQRPAEPAPWREQNERVAPQKKQ
jgi:hypothetical protein